MIFILILILTNILSYSDYLSFTLYTLSVLSYVSSVVNCPIRRQRETEQNSNVALPEMDVVKNLPEAEEKHFIDSCAPQYNIHSSEILPVEDAQDAQRWYSGSQGAEDYNRLLGQYYELEEKRQKILEQLSQFGSWNYLYSGDGSIACTQEVAYPTSQEHPTTAGIASRPDVVFSHCPNACPCLTAPCTSCHASSSDGTSVIQPSNDAVGAAEPLSPLDDDIIKTAMEIARRAISSIQTKSSAKLGANSSKFSLTSTAAPYLSVVDHLE